MKKVLKALGITIGVILIVLITLPYLFKDKIIQAVKDSANETLTASLEFEDLSISLISNFPNASVSIENLSLTGTEEFDGVELVNIGSLEAVMDLSSLMGDIYAIKRIAIDNMSADVRIMADGSANYDIMKPSEPGEVVEDSVATEEGDGSFKLALEEYSLTNSNLSYIDHTMPMHLELLNLNHSGSGDFTEDIVVLVTQTAADEISFDYDGTKYIHKASTNIKANLELNLTESKYSFSDNEILLNDFPLKVDGYVSMPTESIDMDLTFSAPGSTFGQLLSLVPAEFATDLAGVETSGNVDFSGIIKGSYSDTSIPGGELELEVINGRFNYPNLPKSVENVEISVSVKVPDGNNLDLATVDIPKFYLEIAENPIDLSLTLRTPESDPEINFKAQAKVILEQLADVVPLAKGDQLKGSINADMSISGKMSDVEKENYEAIKAEGQIIAQQLIYTTDSLPYDMAIEVAYLNFSPAHAELTQFKANIGKSDMSASGRIDNYLAYAIRDEPLHGKFQVDSDLMDLNEFMDSEEVEGELEESPSTETSMDEEMGTIEVPGNIDFELTANFDQMLYGGIEMKNVRGGMHVHNRSVHVKDLNISMLGGTVKANGSYATPPSSQPLIDFEFDIMDIGIKEASEAFNTIDKLAPIAKSCSGTFSTQLQIKAALGNNMEPIEETIEGSGTLQTDEVYVEKFEPLNKLATELKIKRLAEQNIEDVNLSYEIADGKAIIEPFTVKIDGIPVEIFGETALLTQEIDYTMKMNMPLDRIPGNVASQAQGLLDQLNNAAGTNISAGSSIPLNIRFTGTVDKPTIGTNYGDVSDDAKEGVKEIVKEEIKEVVKELKEDAKIAAQAEADRIMEDAQREADEYLAAAEKLANQGKDLSYNEAKKLEDSAKGPLAKAAARLAADKIRKEADASLVKAMNAAKKQSDKILAEAKKRAEEKIDSVD